MSTENDISWVPPAETGAPFDDSVERQNWIIHKGERVCIRDYANLEIDVAVRIAKIHQGWQERTSKRNMLVLFDVTNLEVSKELVSIFKAGGKDTKERGVFKKVAVIGATGLLRFFTSVVNKFSNVGAVVFDTREEALDWLVEKP